MARYDIAIVGTGPAGLSAAITAKIRNKSFILFGNDQLSNKIQKAHAIDNYLGLPAVSGKELAKRFQDHLDQMGIEITKDKVNGIFHLGEYFGIQGVEEIYEANTIVLATGVVMGKPFDGEEEFLGKGVSYCATCDAMLYRNKTVAVVGYSKKEEEEAIFLAETSKKVYYFPQYKDVSENLTGLEVIMERPKTIVGEDQVTHLITQDSTYEVDGVFILRDSIAPSQLVPGVITLDNHVVVDRTMATNIAGCFACGDVVGRPYQYIKAAGEGNVAALSAVSYIDELKKSTLSK